MMIMIMMMATSLDCKSNLRMVFYRRLSQLLHHGILSGRSPSLTDFVFSCYIIPEKSKQLSKCRQIGMILLQVLFL